MIRQLRLLYAKSNRLLLMLHEYSYEVKLLLFRSYCTCLLPLMLYSTTHYKQSTHSKLRVAFNNVYRRILKLPPRSCASAM